MSGGVVAFATQDTKSLFFKLPTRAAACALFGAALSGAVLYGAFVALPGGSRADHPALAIESGYESASASRITIPATVTTPTPLSALGGSASPVPYHAAKPGVAVNDLNCLATAVYYEARGEEAAGQAAVAQVVLNRARHPAFPKTVCAVVYQGQGGHGCQFSFVCNGAMRAAKEPVAWTRARDIAARALGGYVMAAVGEATSFHATRIAAHGGLQMAQVGSQVFYIPTIGAHGGASRPPPPAAARLSVRAEPTAFTDVDHLTVTGGALAALPFHERPREVTVNAVARPALHEEILKPS
jgi:Cell Wall Hydrolase